MDITVALGGGGIKGIAHIGVLEELVKAGFTIRAIAGTSAGGLVGAVYAAGYSPNEILTILESLNMNKLYIRQSGDGPSLLGYTGLADALTQVLGDCQFSDLKIPFACTAVDTRTAQEVYLSEGRVLDAVLATMAIPGIFPPKIRGEAELVDGGVADPVPVSLARQMNPSLPVIAVALNPMQADWAQMPMINILPAGSIPLPSSILEGFARMRVGQALRIFLQSMDISARMLTEMRLRIDKPDVIIRPHVHQYGMLDAVVPKVLVDIGASAAREAIPELQKKMTWTNTLIRKARWTVFSNKDRGEKKSSLPPTPDSRL
jgi:NTE family protein